MLGCFLGAQNFYPTRQGAFTGEIAPEQLLALGCTYALAGHSERRHVLGETDEFVGRKMAQYRILLATIGLSIFYQRRSGGIGKP